MKELSLLHIALIYLAVINVVTFFVYGIDKWKAKKSKWRIPEVTLLMMAVIGGSMGAWLGMKFWHHKTLHKKFRFGVPLILIAQIALFLFCSCRTASLSANPSSQIEQSGVSQIADKIWAFSQSHPNGFTLDLRTMTEPKEGISVSYAATQNSHSRNQLDKVVNHAIQNDGYIGGWYNKENGLYYFDSTRLFPEDSLQEAIRFGKENGQLAVYVISSSTEIPIMQEHSPNVFLVMYDAEIGKEPLLKAIEDCTCEIKIENMKEVQAYLKECGAFFIATVDGDQPHVRAFGVSEIINDRLYIMTGKVKDVYKQMAKNGKFEICALKPNGSEWMRVTGTLVNDDDLAVKKEFLNRNEGLKSMYKADDDNMAVLYITNGTARFCSFSAPEKKVNF